MTVFGRDAHLDEHRGRDLVSLDVDGNIGRVHLPELRPPLGSGHHGTRAVEVRPVRLFDRARRFRVRRVDDVA